MKYQIVVLTPLDLNSLNGLAKIVPTLLGISLKAECSFAVNPDLERQDCFKKVEDYLEFSTYCSHCGSSKVSVSLEEKFGVNGLEFIDPFDCLKKDLPTIIIHSEELQEYEQSMTQQFKELLDHPQFISSSKILSLL